MGKLWCKLFHQKYWFSNDWGTWHTEWNIHHGKFQIECTKCGRMHDGQYEKA